MKLTNNIKIGNTYWAQHGNDFWEVIIVETIGSKTRIKLESKNYIVGNIKDLKFFEDEE